MCFNEFKHKERSELLFRKTLLIDKAYCPFSNSLPRIRRKFLHSKCKMIALKLTKNIRRVVKLLLSNTEHTYKIDLSRFFPGLMISTQYILPHFTSEPRPDVACLARNTQLNRFCRQRSQEVKTSFSRHRNRNF